MAKAIITFTVTGELEAEIPNPLDMNNKGMIEKWAYDILDESSDTEIFDGISYDKKRNVSAFLHETPELHEVFSNGEPIIERAMQNIKDKALQIAVDKVFSSYPDDISCVFSSRDLRNDDFITNKAYSSFSEDDLKSEVKLIVKSICSKLGGFNVD